MDRILILMAAQSWSEAEKALYSARDNAASSVRLSYGLSLDEEPDDEAAEAMRALGTIQFLCPGGETWQDMPALWQGEGFVLIGHPAMRFTPRWDIAMLHAQRQCQRGDTSACVLTGYLPRPIDPVDAVCPVAAESFDPDGRLCFHRGTPLRYAKAPMPSAFLHTDFCFGPAAFFDAMAKTEEAGFLAAYRGGWSLFTLHKPLIHVTWDMPLTPCAMPDAADPILARFEKQFGLKAATRQLSAMARLGLFTADLMFPMHVPLMVRAQEAVRAVMNRSAKVTPLCVTAYLTLPVPGQNLPEEYMTWFGYLASIKELSLLCYGDSDTLRRIMPAFPNTLEFKRRYGLPMQVEVRPEDALNFLRLSKPFLLAQSREKFLSHSHYAWIDLAALRYPVYERSALDWAALCEDKIVLGEVDRVPDTSMIVVPEPLLTPLCREALTLCKDLYARTGALPEETLLWQTLLTEHPEWFHTVVLPKRRELLMLTMMSREEEFHVLA